MVIIDTGYNIRMCIVGRFCVVVLVNYTNTVLWSRDVKQKAIYMTIYGVLTRFYINLLHSLVKAFTEPLVVGHIEK